MKRITVLEHEDILLCEGSVCGHKACLPEKDFDWLVRMNEESYEKRNKFKLVNFTRNTVSFAGYCGVLKTPSGIDIEVLPKVTDSSREQSIEEGRSVLKKMICTVRYDEPKRLLDARVDFGTGKLLKYYVLKYVKEANAISHKGIKKSYVKTEVASQDIKGRLLMSKQARRMPYQQHINYMERRVYSANRPENRLISYCLDLFDKQETDFEIKKEIRKAKLAFSEIPKSENVLSDFKKWGKNRDVSYYEEVKEWTRWTISQITPFVIKGDYAGDSLFFKTHRLFESYILCMLKKTTKNEYECSSQKSDECLITSNGRSYYSMRPDYIISRSASESNGVVAILDAKWKRINGISSSSNEAGKVSENDIRQMLAYWKLYFEKDIDKGELILVYPSHQNFTNPIECQFNNVIEGAGNIMLTILPFDLHEDRFIFDSSNTPRWIMGHEK